MRTWIAFVVLLAGCAAAPPENDDIVGPFTGITRRFVVDSLVLPSDRLVFVDNLDGSDEPLDQLGALYSVLQAEADATSADAVAAMLAAGTLTPVVEITSDDPALADDDTVGVRFIGADGEAADTMGAELVNGHLRSNRTRYTHHPAGATVHLPLYADADPVATAAVGLEVHFSPDGQGGFAGILNGGLRWPDYLQPAYAGLTQMLDAHPQEHVSAANEVIGTNGMVTYADFIAAPIIKNVLYPNLQLYSNGQWGPSAAHQQTDSLSFGVLVHLLPCDSGRCVAAPPVDRCHDRVRDGDETDVDCGGSCGACAGGATCATASDCQTAGCVAGTCAAATCTDNIQDGFETGLDCGGSCKPCS